MNIWLVVTGTIAGWIYWLFWWWLIVEYFLGYKPTTMGIWWWSGWWWLEHGFGTWLDYEFPIILVMSSSQLTFICFRGIEITNQVNLWWISNGLSLLTIGFLGNISLDEVKNLFKNWGGLLLGFANLQVDQKWSRRPTNSWEFNMNAILF